MSEAVDLSNSLDKNLLLIVTQKVYLLEVNYLKLRNLCGHDFIASWVTYLSTRQIMSTEIS